MMCQLLARRFLSLLVVVSVLLPLLGCGKKTATVSGTVSYKGTKLKGGMIVFYPPDGKPYKGTIGEDGTYRVEQCPTGAAKVVVQTAYMKPPSGLMGAGRGPVHYEPPKEGAAAKSGYKPPDLSGNAKNYVAIPEKYESPEHTTLSYDVKSGSQTKDFNLD